MPRGSSGEPNLETRLSSIKITGRKTPQPELDVEEEADELMDSEPEIVEVPPKNSIKIKASALTSSDGLNSTMNPTLKRKAEAAAIPPKSALRKTNSNAATGNDLDEQNITTKIPVTLSTAGSSKPVSRVEERLRRQLDHALDQIEQMKKREEAMKQKYDKLYASRKDEPDASLMHRITQAEERIKAQDQQIQELLNLQEISQRLASEPGALYFITREAAQQDRMDVEDELERVKKQVVEQDEGKQAELAKHTRLSNEIQAHSKKLEAELEVLRSELQAEIQRSKTLATKSAPTTVRGTSTTSQGDQETIKFYQDLTNFLVFDVKFEKGKHPTNMDRTFRCMCASGKAGKALNFQLRMYWDPSEATEKAGKEAYVEQCKYIPVDLDKEPDKAFLARLDFLSEPFTFAKDQLDVFAKTLADRLAEPDEDAEM